MKRLKGQMSIEIQNLLYGSMSKFLAEFFGAVRTNGDVMNAIAFEMGHIVE